MDIADRIKNKILKNIKNAHVKVINESDLHRGHAGDDGSGETHFLVKVVCKEFSGLSRLERHKLMISLLQQEIKDVHSIRFDLAE